MTSPKARPKLAPKMEAKAQSFRGWPPAALGWFTDLAARNDRAWFQAHREVYDDAVRGPLVALLADLAGEFGPGSISRVNRDTRFSPDKSPYKLQIYARVPHPAGRGTWYVQLRREGLFVGGGLYAPDRERLARVRAAVADDRAGAELEAIVADLRDAGLALMTDGSLKSAPRGYDPGHPRIELLRLVHHAAGTMHPPGRWLHTAAAEDRVVDGWRSVAPLLDWLATHA